MGLETGNRTPPAFHLCLTASIQHARQTCAWKQRRKNSEVVERKLASCVICNFVHVRFAQFVAQATHHHVSNLLPHCQNCFPLQLVLCSAFWYWSQSINTFSLVSSL